AARAAGRRQIFLRPGPQAHARIAHSQARPRRLSQQARHASRSGQARGGAAVAGAIAGELGANRELASRGAKLAKADLVTDMVGEFPELQGLMGRYYATHDGEPADVAAAIEQHYCPNAAGGELPRNPVGALVAVADKLETLVGLFAIDQLPTGD